MVFFSVLDANVPDARYSLTTVFDRKRPLKPYSRDTCTYYTKREFGTTVTSITSRFPFFFGPLLKKFPPFLAQIVFGTFPFFGGPQISASPKRAKNGRIKPCSITCALRNRERIDLKHDMMWQLFKSM